MCMYSVRKYSQIHTDMNSPESAYLHVFRTKIQSERGYRNVHIAYARCIFDMHLPVSCAYVCAYLYVSFSDTYKIYQFISVLYLYVFLVDMHMQDH